MKQIIFIVFFSVLLSSCNLNGNKNTITFKTMDVKCEQLDTELLINIGWIGCIDTFLIMTHITQKDFCNVYSIPSGMKKIYTYGSLGNGPGEFLQPMLTYTYKKTFGLNDINTQTLAVMSLNDNENGVVIKESSRNRVPYKRKKGELNPADYNFVKLDDKHFVSLLCGKDGSFFSLLDSNLQPLLRFGESPIEEEVSVQSSRLNLKGCLSAYDGNMVFATNKLPYLAKYHLENNVMLKDWSFYFDQSFYKCKNKDLLFSKERSFGQVLDLAMDSKYIYVLYLDQLLSEYDFKDTNKSMANKILIFNYDGKPVAKMNLDKRIYRIALYPKMNKIIGLGNMPEPTLILLDNI
ncbi:BF3164 family lipoprotein [uncultured Bacteroides sp.]|uniref:BF3164 family lipoprotein n=2 Tax=uncultured Bacteroides sp. TaxID=162156 RepID=UPI0025EBA5B6|nr:BF3164 family lipoprotein [uncultured Bacteroides sp.]